MYPKMVAVRQRFPADEVADLDGAIREGLRALRLAERLRPSAPVALGVGSRGVSPLRQVVGPERFHATDRELLIEARRRFPRVPLERADLVIVEEMGKNISGTGMDPNVIGMWRRFGGERRPDFARVAVLGLSPASHGNANGIGLADFTTRRLVEAVDWRETYLNALTALDPGIAKVPVTLESDRECIETALDVLARATGREPTVVRIRSTLELAELCVSESLVGSLPGDGSVEVVGRPEPMRFGADGRLA